MGVNYGDAKIFNDYAGPLYNERHIRPGKVGPDATRLMFLKMYDGMMQQLGYASQAEQGRENALDNAFAISSPGGVHAGTERTIQSLYNQGNAGDPALYQQAIAHQMTPEYAMALLAARKSQTQHAVNNVRSTEDQRMTDAYNQALNLYNMAQQTPLAATGMGIIGPNEQWRQESENRRAAGQASQGIGGFISSIAPLGGLMTGVAGIANAFRNYANPNPQPKGP